MGTHHHCPNDCHRTKMAPVETEAMQGSLFESGGVRSGHGLHLLDLGEEAVEECAAQVALGRIG